ncbi:hypothetical protein L484_018788 [Morus notabilis]|uniref:Uncharacterized protein n=1 Tax=Morus notabilis TaxID=981085 RepID=W9RIS2_9ROSA|nr:hypothetical protein L484_018788 [Morus notabilis]
MEPNFSDIHRAYYELFSVSAWAYAVRKVRDLFLRSGPVLIHGPPFAQTRGGNFVEHPLACLPKPHFVDMLFLYGTFYLTLSTIPL